MAMKRVTVTNDSSKRKQMHLMFHGRGMYISCPYGISSSRLMEHVQEILPAISENRALEIAQDIRTLNPGDDEYEITYYERPESLPDSVSSFTLEHLKSSIPRKLYFAFAVIHKIHSVEVIHGSQEGRMTKFDADRDAERLRKKNPHANIYQVDMPIRVDTQKADFNEVE